MEQYQYVEGFQRLHTGLRLRCAAGLSLQFFYFLSIYIMTYNTRFVFQTVKSSITAPVALLQARETRATKSVLVIYIIYLMSVQEGNS